MSKERRKYDEFTQRNKTNKSIETKSDRRPFGESEVYYNKGGNLNYPPNTVSCKNSSKLPPIPKIDKNLAKYNPWKFEGPHTPKVVKYTNWG